MAKITLEFDSIEEAQHAQDAMDGHKWKALVWELDQMLRQTTKYGASVITYGDKPASAVEISIADHYRDTILELTHKYGLKLD